MSIAKTYERAMKSELVFENKFIAEKARSAYVEGLDELFRSSETRAEAFKRGFILRFDFHKEPFVYVGDVGHSAAINKQFAEWHKEEFDHIPAFQLSHLHDATEWYTLLFEVKNNG